MNSRFHPEDQVLSEWLRGAREDLGITQERVAVLMQRRGINWRQQTVMKVESEQRPVTFGEALALAYALGKPLPQPENLRELCPVCHGAAPEGFTCNSCGGAS